jgi:GNAT superfamily N-acetyltransferase
LAIRVYPAGYEDLGDVARIHVTAWKQAYAGQIPQTYLDSLNEDQRLKQWQKHFSSQVVSGVLLARVDQHLAGFISFGPARDEDRQDWGEIYALYVLPRYWGNGTGHQPYQYARRELQRRGLTKAYLWVLESNHRALAAYRRWGGTVEPDRYKEDERGGLSVREIRVAFSL